ncbi:MAG: TetR/AcrR family transcriptional regulator [Candidatus Promineifilaceae bacterium]|jgi:AcrR family transcriptional regulator
MVSPRKKRKARTRQEILDGALALINEEGPDNFSLRALAKRVDYSPAGLYEYFASRDEIIEAVCAQSDGTMRQYLRQVPTDLLPDKYLVALGQAYIQFALQNEAQFMLMFSRSREGERIPYEGVSEDETFRILLDAVQSALDQDYLNSQPDFGRDEIAYGLWALVHGMAVMQLTALKWLDYDFDRADRAVLEAFIDGLKAA